MQRVDDQLYSITSSPLGDKLTVKRYRGDLGAFTVGPGGRHIKAIAFQGSFNAKNLAVAVGPDRTKPEARQEKIRDVQTTGGRLSALVSDDRIRQAADRPVRQLSLGRPPA